MLPRTPDADIRDLDQPPRKLVCGDACPPYGKTARKRTLANLSFPSIAILKRTAPLRLLCEYYFTCRYDRCVPRPPTLSAGRAYETVTRFKLREEFGLIALRKDRR